MWLLWALHKNRPQPGSEFVSRENQIWPHFPGNHLQSPSLQTAAFFFFFSLKQTGKRLISLHSHGVILDWHFCDVVSPNLSHNLSLSRLGCGRLAGNQVCIWCSLRNHARFFCVLNPPPLSSSWPPPLSCIREWPISNMSWQTVLSLRWFHSPSAKWDKIIKKDKCVQSCCVKVEQTSEGFRSWRYCTWPCYRHTVAVFTRGGLLRMFCTIRWTLKP